MIGEKLEIILDKIMSSVTEGSKTKPKKLPLPTKLAVGAVAGIVGTTCIYPIDIVKTRLQASKG